MAIETKKVPYELLARWDEDGKIKGAHVGFALVTNEDGKRLSWTPLDVMAVDIGQGKGFPLKDILDQVHTDALIDRDAAIADKTTADTEKQAALADCAKHESTIAEQAKQIESLKAALAEREKLSAAPESSKVTEAD